MAAKKYIKANPAETVGSTEIVTEILILLPLIKLIQFQLVSRQWCSFIKNPVFDRARDLHQFPASFRNFVSCTDFASTLYIDFFPISINISTPQWKALNLSQDPYGTRILQSCNGLVLCSNFRLNENCWKYYVFNPETKECSVINEPDGVVGVSLAFDPSKSSHYQLVCVVRSRNVFQIHIYCSETSVWRKSGEPFNKHINYEDGVYWNGAVHWIDRYGKDLLRYDIQDHVFKEMPRVPYHVPDRERGLCCYLGKSRDRLNLFRISEPDYFYALNIYQMMGDCSDWYIIHRVCLSYMFDAYAEMIRPGPDTYPFRVLSIVRGEKDEDTFLVLGVPGKVVRCNICSPLILKRRRMQHLLPTR